MSYKGIVMDRTIHMLTRQHQQLVAAAASSPELGPLASSVPHIVALVEDRVPDVDAVILRKDDVRDMLTSFAVEMLQLQRQSIDLVPRRRRARPL